MITNVEGDLPPLLFVHIPKTGGIAIRSQLREQPWLRTWHIGHDPYHVLKLNNNITPEVFKFSVVRNPFTRAYSYYHHFLRFNQIQISFKNFLSMIMVGEVTEKTPLMKYDQSFYIFEEDITEMDKIYRYEELWELEVDLNIRIPKINVGSYSKEEYNNDYDSESVDMVRKIYARDFRNLGYSDEFS
jgi:hypothetical protein